MGVNPSLFRWQPPSNTGLGQPGPGGPQPGRIFRGWTFDPLWLKFLVKNFLLRFWSQEYALRFIMNTHSIEAYLASLKQSSKKHLCCAASRIISLKTLAWAAKSYFGVKLKSEQRLEKPRTSREWNQNSASTAAAVPKKWLLWELKMLPFSFFGFNEFWSLNCKSFSTLLSTKTTTTMTTTATILQRRRRHPKKFRTKDGRNSFDFFQRAEFRLGWLLIGLFWFIWTNKSSDNTVKTQNKSSLTTPEHVRSH